MASPLLHVRANRAMPSPPDDPYQRDFHAAVSDTLGAHGRTINRLSVSLASLWYNVRDFGATGDGSTDDTEAIKAAIAEAGSGGGTLYFPKGVYQISSALTLNYAITLMGADPFQAIIRTTSASADIINIDPLAATPTGITVKGLALIATQTRTGKSVNITSTSTGDLYQVRLSNLYLGTYTGHGVYVNASVQNLYLDDITITEVAQNCYGFYLSGEGSSDLCNNVYMTRCHVLDGVDGTTTTGLLIDSYAQGIYVNQCTFEQTMDYGVRIRNTASATRPPENIFFNQLICDGNTNMGLKIDNAYSVHFDNSWFSSNTTYGLEITAGQDISFNNCHIINNGTWGFVVQGGTEVRLMNSIIDINGSGSTNTYDGVYIAAGVKSFTIIGNHFNRSLSTASHRYSINIVTGASDYYIVAHNNLQGYLTNAISDLGTGVNKVVANNV